MNRGVVGMINSNHFVSRVNLPDITIPKMILPDIKIPKIKTPKNAETKIHLHDLKLVEKGYKIHIENIERSLKNMERIYKRLKDLPR